mgnify:CR=1 FL=1
MGRLDAKIEATLQRIVVSLCILLSNHLVSTLCHVLVRDEIKQQTQSVVIFYKVFKNFSLFLCVHLFFTKRNITVDFHKEECSASYKVFNQNFLLKKYPFNDTSYFIIDYETVEDSEGKGIQHYLCLFTNGNEYRIRIHNFLDESNLDLNSLRKAGIKVLIDEELKRNLRTSITFTGLPKDKFRN